MGLGRMNKSAQIAQKAIRLDGEGFQTGRTTTLSFVHVYREGRHGSVRWANLAAFSEATDLFRMRVIPDVTVEPGMLIIMGTERFEILSVEDIKGRGMYLELLAKKVVPVHG